MQAALTALKPILPSEPFPNISRIHKLAGEQDVAKQINNSVTRNRFLQCSANANLVSL